jgi:hypothetical protein
MILKLTCTSMAVKVVNFLQLSATVKSLFKKMEPYKTNMENGPVDMFPH